MNFVFRIRSRDSFFGTNKTKNGRRFDLGTWYLHVAKASHFWNISGIVDIRGRSFVI